MTTIAELRRASVMLGPRARQSLALNRVDLTLEALDDHGQARRLVVAWENDGNTDHVRGASTLTVTPGIVVFRVRGTTPIPVLLGEPAMTPEALTGAVWVDPPTRRRR